MGRQIKRVALDFEWPIDMLWKGYINPYHSQECKACDNSGQNPATKQIADDFYDFAGTGRRWCAAITQDEVQALVDAGRLMSWTHTITSDGWRKKDPPYVPTAEEINAANSRPNIDAHDAINRWILVETRAKRLGVYGDCATCHGEGCVWASEEVKAQHEAWEDYDPPAGEGYQLWSTTTEGHPMSPVFATADELADWCVTNRASIFGYDTAPRETWLSTCAGAVCTGLLSDGKTLTPLVV